MKLPPILQAIVTLAALSAIVLITRWELATGRDGNTILLAFAAIAAAAGYQYLRPRPPGNPS